jgi:hypothetical protein
MSSAEWETQLEFVATVISELPEVGEDTYRIAVVIFSDKDDFATVFDYNDFEFRYVLLVKPNIDHVPPSLTLMLAIHFLFVGVWDLWCDNNGFDVRLGSLALSCVTQPGRTCP